MVRGSVAFDIPCAICGAVAMHVESTEPGDPPLTPQSMPAGAVPVPTTSAGILTEAGTLNLWRAVDERKAGIDDVRDAIGSGRVAALMDIHPEIVPLYCRACEASYCETHWTTWPVFDPDWPSWFEELRGVCPLGHERCIHD